MRHSNKKEFAIVFNIAVSVILIIAIALLIKFGLSDFREKTSISTDDLANMDTSPMFTAYTTEYVLAELESVDSAVEISRELLEYVRETYGNTAYAMIVNYLDKNVDYKDEMWQELFGASVRVLDYFAHEGQEGYDNCKVISSGKTTCTLSFIGDVVLDDVWKWTPLSIHKNNLDNLLPSAFSTDVISEIKNADILMANHAFAYRNNGKRNPNQNNHLYFGTDKDNVSILKEMGIDIVNIANNHTNDYQLTAFNDTLNILKNEDITYAGGGTDASDGLEPRYLIAGGIKIAYVALSESESPASAPIVGESTSGIVLGTNSNIYAELVSTASKNADYVVAYVDFNSYTEGVAAASNAQVKLAHDLIDRGVDAVIGSSDTTLQEIEYYEGCPIVYGLGSFWQETDEHNTIIFKIKFENFIPQFYCVPCVQENAVTSSVSSSDKASKIFEIMTKSSMGKISIDEDGLISEN